MSAPVRAETESDVPIYIAAEAACWISRLHGPRRSRQMERQCLEWQASSKLHRIAFERCTAAWEAVCSLGAEPADPRGLDAAASVRELLDKLAVASRRPGRG